MKKQQCEHPQCSKTDVVECTLVVYRRDTPLWTWVRDYGLIAGIKHIFDLLRAGFTDLHEYYCANHCKEHGYCFCCGQFWAGVEMFDFGPGWCSNCASEFEDETYDDDDLCYFEGYQTYGDDEDDYDDDLYHPESDIDEASPMSDPGEVEHWKEIEDEADS